MTDARRRRLERWLAKSAQLSWAERGLLLESVLVIQATGLLLRVWSLDRVHRLLERQSAGALRRRARASKPVPDVAGAVRLASNHTLIRNTCLHRSLALWWLLRRRGIGSEIRFGVRKRDGRFEAHAWVEWEGVVVNDDPDTDRGYIPVARENGGKGRMTVVRFAPDVVVQVIDNEAIVLNLRKEHVFSLNDTGTRIAQLIMQGVPVETIVERLAAEYSQASTDVAVEVRELVAALIAKGLVVAEDGESQ